MDYWSLVLLIVIHVLFDFVFQSREVAKNKSSKLSYLIPHLFILFIGLSIYAKLSGRYTPIQGQVFVIWNIVFHGIIDWNIWRLYKLYTGYQIKKGRRTNLLQGADQNGEQYRYWDDSTFYNFIAIDQALHGLCYIGLDIISRMIV